MILTPSAFASAFMVALRKESVDRNLSCHCLGGLVFLSLSARRAWIEMDREQWAKLPLHVALRKESVDRNRCMQEELYKRDGRSPQGERG